MFFACPIPLFLGLTAAALTVALLAGYAYATYHYGKWRRLGVPHTEPKPLFGHVGDTIMGRMPLIDILGRLYRLFDGHRYFGIYEVRKPVLVVRDPALVHAVLVKDSAGYFCDRRAGKVSFEHDRLYDHLVNLRGDQWKAVRAKLSPTFSAAKLKSMLADMNLCTERLNDSLRRSVANHDGTVNVSEASAQYTTDTIGCCAFGLDFNSLSDPDSEFRQAGRDVFTPSLRSVVLNCIRLVDLGWLLDLFRVRGMPDHIYDFFDRLLETAWGQHETGESDRNDFIALLARLKNEEKHVEPEQRLFKDDILAANAFVFFIAGFETTASTITYCLYEMAKNPEIQNKLRKNINQTLSTTDGKLSYDTLKDMKYLDMVIKETLRIHPPVPALIRVCTKKYTIPDSKITLNVGDKVMIPVYSFHHDPKYFPNPEVFDPERFTEENKTSRPHGTYLPFGDGPRICIGMRFALMEAKMGLAEILTNFEVMPCKETPPGPIKINPLSVLLTPVDPIYLQFKELSR